MLKLRLRNDFLEISEKNSSKKWFPTQLNSIAKNSRTDLFQESLALNFKWNTLTARISWQRMHSKLVDIFSHFSQLYHSCVLHRSCWISASSWLLPTLIWLTLFGAHRFRLEVEDFLCCSILQRNFANFGMAILALLSSKSFQGLHDGHICHILKAKIKRPVFRKLIVINLRISLHSGDRISKEKKLEVLKI